MPDHPMGTIAPPSSETRVDLAFVTVPYVPPPCEGPSHPELVWSHTAGQPASFLVVFPCGHSILMCAGWVHARGNENPGAICHCNAGCNGRHRTDELRFYPID